MIIVSRCPYRISLLGGGSDLDWFVEENDYGISLGYSLSKYSYTVINKVPFNTKRGVLNYSTREEYVNIQEIAHPLFKAALTELEIYDLLEISSFGFASRGSGLGGSSSFLISLLKGLSLIKNNEIEFDELANLASEIEINKIKKPIGRQDHFISASGKISCFKYLNDNKKVIRKNLSLAKEKFLRKTIDNLYLVPSFVARSADKVLHHLKDLDTTNKKLLEIRKIAEKFINLEEDRDYKLEEVFNSCVKESWEIKKHMSGVMTGILNDQYNVLIKLPLNWIRLLGAGSGGYFLISSKLTHIETNKKFKDLGIKEFFKASISESGVEIVHSHE